ncbi:MAG: adenine phosphoribosyltransferase [Alphaproteobacteria bacterium]|nr:adenine phosphoribosyltransferase [Alphaproteobacteria bacterium]
MQDLESRLKATIRDIPDFPKPGILFKDITPVLADPKLLRATIDHFAELYAGEHIDVVVGMESRGFLFGAPLAMELSAAFAPARKPGKLPYDRISVSYDLEYGSATLQLHSDAIKPGDKVLIVDDLLATGGTAEATCQLVEQLGGEVVACCFVVELTFIPGRDKLGGRPVQSIVKF